MSETTTEKQLLPEVKELVDGWDAIDAEVTKLRDAMNNPDLSTEAYAEARAAWRAVNNEKWESKHRLATAIASRDETDKLVAFIIENYLDDFDWQSMLILKALPATLDELNDIALDQSWCSTWTSAVNKAVEAGAIKLTEEQAVRQQLRSLLRHDMYNDDVVEVMKLVDKLAELKVAEATDSLAKTANLVVDALSS